MAKQLLEAAKEDAAKKLEPDEEFRTLEEWLANTPEVPEPSTNVGEVGREQGASIATIDESEALPSTALPPTALPSTALPSTAQRFGALPTPAQTSDPAMGSSDPITKEAVEEEAGTKGEQP